MDLASRSIENGQPVRTAADAKKLLLQLRNAFQALPATKREELRDLLREGSRMLEIEEGLNGSGPAPSLAV